MDFGKSKSPPCVEAGQEFTMNNFQIFPWLHIYIFLIVPQVYNCIGFVF